MSSVFDLEYSALQMLIKGERELAERGISLWLAGLNPSVLEVVRHTPLAERLGRERLLFNDSVALERYLARPPSPPDETPARPAA